ncbi:MAG: hypothetical protein P8L85_23185 [Rubripirellula sp.]|nr:hypothetical protein [Rubripirellula sp.]
MKNQFGTCGFVLFLSTLLFAGGCSKQAVEDAEQAVESTAGTIADDAGAIVQEGEAIVSGLGEAAMSSLAPLKEKFGGLDALKDKPAELKAAVVELIQSIEAKADGVTLPEGAATALETLKEKLVALRDYLGGEVDQAKIDEQLKGIMDSVKSSLGMASE